jgi:IPT/TIG domain
MSQTRTTASRRTRFGRVVAVTAVASLATAGSLLSITGASAAAVSTITAVGPHLVTALTLNQVITVTGTGFDEAEITGVAIAGCTTAPTYIVASTTSLVLKTAVDCAAGAGALRVITITETGGTTVSVPATAAQALTFVAAPTLIAGTAALHPVTTDGASGLAYAAQTTAGISASTKGGTRIRVTAALGSPYSHSTALPLSATLGGTALTGIVKETTGLYFTGVIGAHAASAAPILKITNNGVSKSFAYAAPGIMTGHSFTYAGSSISVSPAFGVSNGANKLTITGAGFSTTPASNAITVGGVACPVGVYTATATTIACTVPAALTPFQGPVNVQVVVTGGTALTSTISSGSTYTYVAK